MTFCVPSSIESDSWVSLIPAHLWKLWKAGVIIQHQHQKAGSWHLNKRWCNSKETPGFIENLITQNSFYPDFIKRVLTWREHYFYLLCYVAWKLNIHGLLSPYLHTMCFFFTVGVPFSRTLFSSQSFCNLSSNCSVEFWLSALLWHLSAEWNKQKLCKVSSLLHLCTSDIWKWDHCHVASLSKDSK